MPNDLYGAVSDNIDEVKAAVEAALECDLQGHESTYHGLYYRAVLLNREEIIVKRNADPFDGEPVEVKYSDYPVIIYVNNTSRTAQLQKAFMNVKPVIALLRSK